MTVDEQINFFFAPPCPEQNGGTRSTLHLLRREIQDCLIGTVTAEEQAVEAALRTPHRLFASAMVLMAGVDLLAKFCAGSDRSGEVGTRFEAFAGRFIFDGYPSRKQFAHVLYLGLRNPLLHSFSLYNHEVKITLTSGHSLFVVATNPEDGEHYVIGLERLYRAFVEAIRAYQAELAASAETPRKFASIFPKYGSIGVFAAIVERRQ